MTSFQQERQRIAKDLAEAQAQEVRLLGEVDRMTAELTRVRARIASLKAADRSRPESGVKVTSVIPASW